MFTNKIYLKNREIIANDTIKIVFVKPINFNFVAGQYVLFGVKDKDETYMHPMTIASAPFQEELEFIMRITDSPFKTKILNMKIGDEAYIGNANGAFILGDKSQSAVFLAGGIGITPFRSILKQAEHEKSRQSFILFYSNSSESKTIELNDLKNIGLDNYHTIFTLSNPTNEVWLGEKGRINKAMLLKYLPQLSAHIYYIVGTTSFVTAMVEILENSNIPRGQIKTESFAEYINA